MNHTDMKSYMLALDEERRKIHVFQRELPLCMELVTQAIDACKKQILGAEDSTQEANRKSEIMKEFIPIRRDPSSCDVDEVVDADDEYEHHSHCPIDADDDKKKSDWLRSVSLWNHNPVMPLQAEPVKVSPAMEVKSDDNGGALQPLQKEKTAEKSNQSLGRLASPPGSATTTSSTADTSAAGGNRRSEEKHEGPTTRKQRRCWSPELHRRFMHALQQLGGSHATPKQIRDLMKVDGLTNDEVKSHLQKYRLHTRRQSSSTGNAAQPPPQFVVVGGIWVPPPPSQSVTTAAANRIYAPVALLPPAGQQQQRHHHQVSLSNNKAETSSETHRGSADSSSSTHTIDF